MECAYCLDNVRISAVTSCCYQPLCQWCANDPVETCLCGQPKAPYLIPGTTKSPLPSMDAWVEKKNTWLDTTESYLWKIMKPSRDEYVQLLTQEETKWRRWCQNYTQLVDHGIWVEPLVIPEFQPIGVVFKKNSQNRLCVVSMDFDNFLRDNIDKSWDWIGLSENPNITIEHVLAYPDKNWNWYTLSKNPNITLEHVLAHPELNWNWYALSENPNITFDQVLAHPKLKWEWNEYEVSRNPNITLDHVLAHPENKWSWYGLSKNPNITFDQVLAHPNKPWNWDGVSQNSNITRTYVGSSR